MRESILLVLHIHRVFGKPFGPRVMIGKVKWFTDAGGYGLIRRSDGPDVFVHRTAIAGERRTTLNEGDVVEFELVQGAHGPQAANVIVGPKNQRGYN